MRTALPAAVLLSFGAWLFCIPIAAAQTAAPGAVVATVDGAEILRSEIAMMHRTLAPEYQRIPPEKIYDQLLDRIIDQKLVAGEARKSGLLDDPDIKRRLDFLMEGAIRQVYLDAKLAALLSEDNLRLAYRERIKGIPRQEEVRARHILLKTESEAMAVIEELRGGTDFAELAGRKSIGPSGKSGGDLGFFTRGRMLPAFSKAAFAMKKGDFTAKPVKTRFGWHVIKVEGRRFAAAKSYDEMAGELRDRISRETVDKIIAGLRAKADIRKGGSGAIRRVP